ncbi:MAG: phosphate ABC transporter permease subunit PstC [Bacillaceae bacterium G1]|nr:phosphate ABC transporter permease subunit PstC [Bacillota bacterium]OJF17657.1 MAG: phosphate ABC transporter permease subunit PstC [Bacillaceae bacterium G1]
MVRRLAARNPGRFWDKLMPKLLFILSSVTILTTLGIVLTLVLETTRFFQEVSLAQFFLDTRWTPLLTPQHFGIWPLICGTLLVTGIAVLIAIPIGLGSAIYLSEYAPESVRRTVKPVLEILAGIPTIVYGYFALNFLTADVLKKIFPEISTFNALSAGIAVGIMITPMISSLSEDAMSAVPRRLREGAYALGSTRLEVVFRVVLPAALSGIISSFVLAFSRAIGETMIVTVAAGSTPKLTLNPLESIQTMTAYIVQVATGDISHGGIEYSSVFAVGTTLFLFTLAMNILAQYITRKFREEYD